MTKDSSAKRKAGKRKPEKLSFTQDFIPIKNLEHGIIETADGRYIKILEVEPINFMMRSAEEQYAIISSFASWLWFSLCSFLYLAMVFPKSFIVLCLSK